MKENEKHENRKKNENEQKMEKKTFLCFEKFENFFEKVQNFKWKTCLFRFEKKTWTVWNLKPSYEYNLTRELSGCDVLGLHGKDVAIV